MINLIYVVQSNKSFDFAAAKNSISDFEQFFLIEDEGNQENDFGAVAHRRSIGIFFRYKDQWSFHVFRFNVTLNGFFTFWY